LRFPPIAKIDHLDHVPGGSGEDTGLPEDELTTPSIVLVPRLLLSPADVAEEAVLESISNLRPVEDETPEPENEDEEIGTSRTRLFATYDYLPVRRGLPYTLTMDSYIGLKIGDGEGACFPTPCLSDA
jgi:hypothetical protein